VPPPQQPGQYPARQDGLPQRDSRGPQSSPDWVPGGGQDLFDTGAHRLPGRPDGGGQYPVPQQQGDTGQFPVPQGGQPYGTGQYPVQQPVPPQQQPAERRPAPQQRPEPRLPAVNEPMALPPAPTRGDEPTPIFSSMESDWFRTGQAERMQQIHVEQSARGQQSTPPSRPVGRTAPPQRPRADRPGTAGPQRRTGAPQSAAPASPVAPAPGAPAPAAPVAQPLPRETPNWRSSPNDALRQRAEQVREPSAGGVTPSGLPRRVPRANLVPGGAAQPAAPQSGPQVSRSPDDVRGRLTNLRRGIQQGRQAGGTTDGRGFGTNSQER
jgi:hypothetical protein